MLTSIVAGIALGIAAYSSPNSAYAGERKMVPETEETRIPGNDFRLPGEESSRNEYGLLTTIKTNLPVIRAYIDSGKFGNAGEYIARAGELLSAIEGYGKETERVGNELGKLTILSKDKQMKAVAANEAAYLAKKEKR